MTWLEPLWLAYPTAALAILVLLFALSVRWTLRAHPVTSLNYAYEPRYARHYPTRTQPVQFVPGAMWAVSATSAAAYIPLTREQVMHRRAMEDLMFGSLPSVES